MSKIKSATADDELKALVLNRHNSRLTWYQPTMALAPQGDDILAHLTISATVHDCINMARLSASKISTSLDGDDMQLLAHFIATHWAFIQE